MFENLCEDLKTYNGNVARQGFWVMLVYRFGRWRYKIQPRLFRMPFSLLYKIFFKLVQIMTGVELPCETRVGKRLRIPHFGDIIISGDSVIGDDVVLRNGVTVGLRHTGERGSPKIGNRVDIGAGAKILGSITIGDDVKIGANAVVLEDVPAGAMAVGVPAHIILRKEA